MLADNISYGNESLSIDDDEWEANGFNNINNTDLKSCMLSIFTTLCTLDIEALGLYLVGHLLFIQVDV